MIVEFLSGVGFGFLIAIGVAVVIVVAALCGWISSGSH